MPALLPWAIGGAALYFLGRSHVEGDSAAVNIFDAVKWAAVGAAAGYAYGRFVR